MCKTILIGKKENCLRGIFQKTSTAFKKSEVLKIFDDLNVDVV